VPCTSKLLIDVICHVLQLAACKVQGGGCHTAEEDQGVFQTAGQKTHHMLQGLASKIAGLRACGRA
jgi:hypothetical protein